MTLVAVVVLLAIVALFAVVLFEALIREIDRDVARQESAALKTFGTALQSGIQRHGYIPSSTNWAGLIVAETGVNPASVTTNPRRQPRLLLIDSSGWLATNLPYTQTSYGTLSLPARARLLLASSLGQPLPLSAGLLSASDFAALWNAAEGTTNFPATGPWAGWTGRPEDVKLERIDLTPLFVSLYLMTYASPYNGLYSIGTNTALCPAAYYTNSSPSPPRYYLQNTVLRLYNNYFTNTPLDSTQILIRDGSFLYEDSVWKSSAAGGIMPGGVDVAGVVSAFLNAVPNTRALYSDQQRRVVLSMMDYMSNYLTWAGGGFTDANLKTYLRSTVQPNLMNTVQGLFMNPYYPTNAGGAP